MRKNNTQQLENEEFLVINVKRLNIFEVDIWRKAINFTILCNERNIRFFHS